MTPLLFNGYWDPYHRGFECNDTSIAKPFKPNTVSTRLLLSICCGVPFLVIEVVEFLLLRSNRKPKWCRSYLSTTAALNLEYFFGFAVAISFMHVTKSAFGHLRPHFLAVCQPNYTAIDCNQPIVMEPFCTNSNMYQVRLARESFPSGHAMVAVYSAFFLYFYLSERRKVLNVYIFGAFLTAYTAWAVVCCITRITDYWHHPKDVVAGIILGILVAFVLFRKRENTQVKRPI